MKKTKKIIEAELNLNKQLALAKKLAVPMFHYYHGEYNKYEVIGRSAEIIFGCNLKNELPDGMEIEWFLEWLNGMAITADKGLGIKSSGSFWTALWDSDPYAENAFEKGVEETIIDEFTAELELGRSHGCNGTLWFD